MKKRNAKMVSLGLTAAMVVTMTACGTNDVNTSSAASETKDVKEEVKADSNFNATGYPIVNEPVTLRVLVSKHARTDPYTDLKVFQDLEEKTNIKIEWEYAEGDDWQTQKPLLLASGKLPDIFMGSSLRENDVINNVDLFMDMSEYIEKYCPNIQTMFEESPFLKAMATAYDGNIYGLPHQMPCRPSSFDMAFINQKWLDNLNLKMPATTDELYDVLKAFKEEDANGNGDPNDEIPMSFMGFTPLTGCLSLYGSFGSEAVDNTAVNISLTDGKAAYTPIQDGFKEGTKYLQKLYAEGLIDVEAFTNDWSTYPAKLRAEGASKVGVAFHWSNLTAIGDERAEEYVPLMPLKGPNGDQYWRYNPDSVKAGKYYAEVSKDCKNPEIAMRWLDALYDQEESMQIFYGAIGTTMQKNEDGTYEVLPPSGEYDAVTWAWKFSMNDQFTGYVGDKFSEKITPPVDVQLKLEADKQYEKYFKDEYYPAVNFTKEQLDELSTLSIDVTSYFEETISSWIVNGGDIDAEWPGYVEQMKKMGVDRFVEIYQEAYDAYVK